MNNLKNILYKSKQSIDVNKSENPTDTLSITFHKPSGESNSYVWFEYVSQKILYHTWGKFSVPINTDPINAIKQIKNQWC